MVYALAAPRRPYEGCLVSALTKGSKPSNAATTLLLSTTGGIVTMTVTTDYLRKHGIPTVDEAADEIDTLRDRVAELEHSVSFLSNLCIRAVVEG